MSPDSEPWEWLHVAVTVSERPCRVVEPDDAIRHVQARLFRYSEEEGEPSTPLATIDWLQIEYGFGIDYEVPAFDIADAHSQVLHELHTVLFDEDGEPRAPFDALAGVGHDVLVIEEVQVHAPEHFAVYAAELVEHVLRRWSYGCFAAVYVEDLTPAPELYGVLQERGFQWHKTHRFGIYVADLGAPRPPVGSRITPPQDLRGRSPACADHFPQSVLPVRQRDEVLDREKAPAAGWGSSFYSRVS